VNSHITSGFRGCFSNLPERIQKTARKSYLLWKKDPLHPSLSFKRVGKNTESYSVRIGIGWRALGIKDKDTMIWFWVGSHSEYNNLIKHI
jgi:hypothetical protein